MKELDFTWMNTEAPTEQNKGTGSTEELGGTGKLQRIADQNQSENARAADILKRYQDNIKRTTKLRSDITKGLQNGADIYSLFLQAIEALSLCISDNSFYDRSRSLLTSVYGAALREETPLELERDAVAGRLEKLRAAAGSCTDEQTLHNIRAAIAAHERKLSELQ